MTSKKLNDEFGLNDELEVAPAPAPKKAPAKKRSPKKVAEVAETPKSSKVWIMIDEVPGMSNSETVGHNGDVIQIKRGVPVEVDEKYVHVLELAVETSVVQVPDRENGGVKEEKRNFSAIPWRRVSVPRKEII